jgi:hypothetical protein
MKKSIKTLALLLLGGTVAFLMQGCGPTSDSFGKDHPIPEGMDFEIPWAENAPTPAIDTLSVDSYFQLWNGIQGGIYLYSLTYPALPDGEVYLRCYEATENIELSASRLKGATTVAVKGHTAFGPVVEKQQFTIYEGDWDDYYAARIEVWHHDASTGQDTKLMEKTYRVEGWMR